MWVLSVPQAPADVPAPCSLTLCQPHGELSAVLSLQATLRLSGSEFNSRQSRGHTPVPAQASPGPHPHPCVPRAWLVAQSSASLYGTSGPLSAGTHSVYTTKSISSSGLPSSSPEGRPHLCEQAHQSRFPPVRAGCALGWGLLLGVGGGFAQVTGAELLLCLPHPGQDAL